MVTNEHNGSIIYHFGLQAEGPTHLTTGASLEPPLLHAANEPRVELHPSNGNGHQAVLAATPSRPPSPVAEKLEELLHLESTPTASSSAATKAEPKRHAPKLTPTHTRVPSKSKAPHTTARQPSTSNGAGPASTTRGAGVDLTTDLDTLEYGSHDAYALLSLYSGLCDVERLDDALVVIKQCIRAKRNDVLIK